MIFFFKNVLKHKKYIYICSPLEIASYFSALKTLLKADVAQLARAADL